MLIIYMVLWKKRYICSKWVSPRKKFRLQLKTLVSNRLYFFYYIGFANLVYWLKLYESFDLSYLPSLGSVSMCRFRIIWSLIMVDWIKRLSKIKWFLTCTNFDTQPIYSKKNVFFNYAYLILVIILLVVVVVK